MSFEQQNRARMIAYFNEGCHSIPLTPTIGVEVEHFVVQDGSGAPVSYAPQDSVIGVSDILEHLSSYYTERTLNPEGELIGLANDEANITLEPAAQVEISIAPFSEVARVAQAYQTFRDLIDPYLAEHGCHLESTGYHPTTRALDMPLIPKRRYDFMNEWFHSRGYHGERMMRGSASTQVSVDFVSEADAVRKLRVAGALAPVLAAIADNTQTFEGEPNSTPIARLYVWRDVDNDHCRVIPGLFKAGFGFEALVDWMMSESPIFVTRPAADDPEGEAVRWVGDKTAAEAYADAPMTDADLEHLISMFWPDVRCKRFVEVRAADSMPAAQVAGYGALIKGLFYSDVALSKIENALGVTEGINAASWPLTEDAVEAAIENVRAKGFAADVYGIALREWVDIVFEAAREGLLENERAMLQPLYDFAITKPWWEV